LSWSSRTIALQCILSPYSKKELLTAAHSCNKLALQPNKIKSFDGDE
jgi:hypothetical protein